jgi:hypothetical protein
MTQLAFNFNPVRVPRLNHRSYGGWTPSQWSMTSLQAAESIEPFAPNLREKVLMVLTRRSLANHELEALAEMKLQTVCARVAELREDDLIKDSCLRRLTDSNRQAVVWKVTDLGAKIGWCMINAGREFY